MKKLVYTIAFVSTFAFCGNAQTQQPAQQEKKQEQPQEQPQEQVNPDGTTAPAQKADKPKDKSRMAINEKGVPASKAKKKEEKPTDTKKKAEAPASNSN